MKIVYWDTINRQNFPIICYNGLIKPRGFFHKGLALRRQIETMSSFPYRTFLLPLTNPDDLYDLPDNVLPVLHASNDYEVEQLLPCLAEQRIKIISLFCHEPIMTHNIQADWFIVSSNTFMNLRTVFDQLSYQRKTIYVEHYKGSRVFENIPIQFRRRLIPKQVAYEVVKNDFLNFDYNNQMLTEGALC